jgi:3-hydroxymyristoyl/3-hydroxydecanoyl-(acyl carrier protein) dehydratase
VTERHDSAALLRLLPHRFPFIFVDSIEVIEAGKRVRGFKRITGSECLLDPESGVPIAWPNLLVIEALAQSSVGILADLVDGAEGAIGYFVRMDQVKLREPAVPGDTLVFDIELLRARRGLARVRGVARVGDRLVARATFTVALRATSESEGS